MKPNSKDALCWITCVVVVFGTLAILQSKFKFMGELPSPSEIRVGGQPAAPPMPEFNKEAKSESTLKSPVLEKALGLQKEWDKTRILLERLREKDIKIFVFVESKRAEVFLSQLMADENSQKIFRHFNQSNIGIYLFTEYRVGERCVYINVVDGVKKTAKWLATGKI